MSLETATYINQLDAANPLGSDPVAQGDDHIRLIKSTVKATFPNITGPVTKTQTELNNTVQSSRSITGTGSLTGGGDLTADRTLDVVNGGITAAKLASGVAKANLGWSSWGVVESGNVLYFQYNGVNKAKLDSSGNLTVAGDVTAFGTV